jgi:VanZ like family
MQNKILFYWVPFFAWAIVIFLFSSFPTGSVSEIHWEDFIVKKMAHVIEYGIFAALLFRASRVSGVSIKRSGYLSILAAACYGISDEFHQSFTPGREPHIRDVAFDTIGATIAIYTLWILLPKAPTKLRALAVRLFLI